MSDFAVNILVATDLSEASYGGLAEAARLCRAHACHARLYGLRARFFTGLSSVHVCTLEHVGTALGSCATAARFETDLVPAERKESRAH